MIAQTPTPQVECESSESIHAEVYPAPDATLKATCNEIIGETLALMAQIMTQGRTAHRVPFFTDPIFRGLSAALLTPGTVEQIQQASDAFLAYIKEMSA
jgi:hypothetical protein